MGLAVTIMTLRILTGKSTPASGNDPIYMNTINRIITNTIEQSIIFAGLFAPILFSEDNHVDKIGGNRVLTLAALFVVGRVVYAVGYLLGTMTGISSCRGMGFSIGLITTALMASYHLGVNLFGHIDTHVAPVLKGFLWLHWSILLDYCIYIKIKNTIVILIIHFECLKLTRTSTDGLGWDHHAEGLRQQ